MVEIAVLRRGRDPADRVGARGEVRGHEPHRLRVARVDRAALGDDLAARVGELDRALRGVEGLGEGQDDLGRCRDRRLVGRGGRVELRVAQDGARREEKEEDGRDGDGGDSTSRVNERHGAECMSGPGSGAPTGRPDVDGSSGPPPEIECRPVRVEDAAGAGGRTAPAVLAVQTAIAGSSIASSGMTSRPMVPSCSTRWTSGRLMISWSIPSDAWSRPIATRSDGVHPAGAQIGVDQAGHLDRRGIAAGRLRAAPDGLDEAAAFARIRVQEVARVGIAGDEPGGPARPVAADQDAWAAGGERRRHVDRLLQPVMVARDRRAVAGEHRPGDPERLLEPGEALGRGREGESETEGFPAVPAGAETERRPTTAGQDIERRRLLHERSGMAEMDTGDQWAELDPVRRLGQEPERRVRLEHRLLRAPPAGVLGQLEPVVHHPEAGEPRRLGSLGDLDEGRAD